MTYLRHTSRHLAKTINERVTEYLTTLGWTIAPPFQTTPVEIVTRRIRESELQSISGNKVGLFYADETDDQAAELGGGLMQNTTHMLVDVVAVNDGIGLALSSDIKDCLSGRLSDYPRIVKLRDYTTNPLGDPLDDHILEFVSVSRERPQSVDARQLFWQVIVAEVQLTFPGEE